MTIAGVYLSPEGVVLGADSTSSVSSPQGMHFYDFNQKLFEIGEGGTLGLLTWGMGGFETMSYRTLLAELADDLLAAPATSVGDVISRWTDKFWALYSAYPPVVRANSLAMKAPCGSPPNAAGVRTENEEQEWQSCQLGLHVGFCIAGYVLPSRAPEAHSVAFQPGFGKPQPVAMNQHVLQWWGVPNFFSRLLFGADHELLNSIHASGKWQGNRADLDAIAQSHAAVPPSTLPIRDAVDYVHTCIICTIKAIKFSGLPQVCGGPVELAVITSDRKFRWVRHKQWDAALDDGVV